VNVVAAAIAAQLLWQQQQPHAVSLYCTLHYLKRLRVCCSRHLLTLFLIHTAASYTHRSYTRTLLHTSQAHAALEAEKEDVRRFAGKSLTATNDLKALMQLKDHYIALLEPCLSAEVCQELYAQATAACEAAAATAAGAAAGAGSSGSGGSSSGSSGAAAAPATDADDDDADDDGDNEMDEADGVVADSGDSESEEEVFDVVDDDTTAAATTAAAANNNIINSNNYMNNAMMDSDSNDDDEVEEVEVVAAPAKRKFAVADIFEVTHYTRTIPPYCKTV
jgi:hypothetical protein